MIDSNLLLHMGCENLFRDSLFSLRSLPYAPD